jgi:hypothetical protein
MLAADPASDPVHPVRRWGIFAVMFLRNRDRDGE